MKLYHNAYWQQTNERTNEQLRRAGEEKEALNGMKSEKNAPHKIDIKKILCVCVLVLVSILWPILLCVVAAMRIDIIKCEYNRWN